MYNLVALEIHVVFENKCSVPKGQGQMGRSRSNGKVKVKF